MKVVRILSLVITGVLFFYILSTFTIPRVVDKKYNTVTLSPPYEVSVAARSLYDSLPFIADLHCDALLWKRDLSIRHTYGHLDFPRMQEANEALQGFTIVSKTPKNMNFNSNTGDSDNITTLFIAQGRPITSWFNLTERALLQCQQLKHYAIDPSNHFRVITSAQSLSSYIIDRKSNKQLVAGFLGIEGMQVLRGQLSNVDKLYDAGVRMMAPVHFFDNRLGGSAHGIQKGGLTNFGRKVIRKMEEKHMIVDLAHASPTLIDDVLAMATQPVVVSHTGVKGTCDNIRNLSDRHLKLIAEKGGLIGIAAFQQADCGLEATATAKALAYASHLVGVEHVALGSDFDGAVRTHYDITGYPLLVDALLHEGFSHQQIALIMGENVLSFLMNQLPST